MTPDEMEPSRTEREIARVSELVRMHNGATTTAPCPLHELEARVMAAGRAIERPVASPEQCWPLANKLWCVLVAEVHPLFIEEGRRAKDTKARAAWYQRARKGLGWLLSNAPAVIRAGTTVPEFAPEVAALRAEWLPILEGLDLVIGAPDA